MKLTQQQIAEIILLKGDCDHISLNGLEECEIPESLIEKGKVYITCEGSDHQEGCPFFKEKCRCQKPGYAALWRENQELRRQHLATLEGLLEKIERPDRTAEEAYRKSLYGVSNRKGYNPEYCRPDRCEKYVACQHTEQECPTVEQCREYDQEHPPGDPTRSDYRGDTWAENDAGPEDPMAVAKDERTQSQTRYSDKGLCFDMSQNAGPKLP